MHLTPVIPTLLVGTCDQPRAWGRLTRNGLRDKSVEQLSTVSRRSTVKQKCEFIEVEVQLLTGQCTLMDTQQPALQQGGYPVHAGQQDRRRLATGANHTW